jgi:hypothetical protein
MSRVRASANRIRAEQNAFETLQPAILWVSEADELC